MFATQGLQFPDELSVEPQGEIRSGAGLGRPQGQLVQMRPFDVREAGVGELGQRLPPPQRQRLCERGGRQRRLTLLHQPTSGGDELLEADDIHVVGIDAKRIAGFGGDDRR